MTKKKEEAVQPEVETVEEQQVETAVESAAPEQPCAEDKLETQLKEAQDRNLRLMAEFDNFRRRTLKEKEGTYSDAVAETIKELLPVLDNFERALAAPCTDEEYRKGVQMTHGGFMETLKKLGLEEFGETGETFDPAIHNAVMHVDDESLGQNVLAQVFQRGYRMGDRILRFAMVQQAN